MSSTDNINIREIVARFQNSAEVIDELRGRLQSISRTDDLHGVSLKTAQLAAQSLEESSAQLRTAIELVRNSLTTADSAMTTATAFMKSTDLSEVSRQLQSLGKSQTAANKDQAQALEEIRKIIQTEIAGIRNELAAVNSSDRAGLAARLTEAESTLTAVRNEIGRAHV